MKKHLCISFLINGYIIKKTEVFHLLPNLEAKQLFRFMPGFKAKQKDNEYLEFCSVVAMAHQEWMDAQNFFENVAEAELVDHAIYKMEAAKSKYTYLLKVARENGINIGM